MFEPLLFLLFVLSAIYVWHSALRARERAIFLSRALCADARVQLLDQSVALRRLGLRRVPGSGLRVWRCYGFDVSTDGSDRVRCSLDLLDGEIAAYDIPGTTNATSPPAPERGSSGNVIELRPRERTLH